VPGERADVVVVVHRVAGTVRALSIPRDLLVVDAEGHLYRVALALEAGGAQSVVDGLCRTLSIPADHVVQVDFAGFASAVDAVGGIDIELARAIRDGNTGLDQPQAGRVRFDGVTALSYVRSRHAEELIGGTWQPEVDGAVGRATRILEVLTALRDAADRGRRNPLTVRRVALALAPHLTVDRGTSPADLFRLVGGPVRPEVVPTTQVDGSLARGADDATRAVVAAAGFEPPCTPREIEP
jgi:LCP family protein required for cell wall assembly